MLGGDAAKSTEPPADEVGRAIAEIWRESLQCEAVAPDADFFVAGGNSVSAIQVAARIGERWKIEFPVSAMYENPRLAAVAERVRGSLREASSGKADTIPVDAIATLPVSARHLPLPLSFAQQRLWFFGSSILRIPRITFAVVFGSTGSWTLRHSKSL